MTLNRFPVAYELPGMPGLGGSVYCIWLSVYAAPTVAWA